MSHQQRNEKKAHLLHQIQQQRLDLSLERTKWLEKTTRYDDYWLHLMQWRRYWLLASGAIALYGVRHPNRLIRWVRRGIGVIGTLKLLRKTFSSY